ncbi:MAG: peptidylprolyl isomerase [candidate division KSB1 bacterium]|nr:peptidylprolyl isomerase [candidate division KSB1 bacterium]
MGGCVPASGCGRSPQPVGRRFRVLVWGFAVAVLLACARERGEVLAVVGRRAITAQEFSRRLSSLRQRLSLPDNLQTRRRLLDQMIEEELLLIEARRRSYDRDSTGRFELERIRIQELLDGYLEERVFPRVRVSEEELMELYRRLNTRVRARHLYAASRAEAESLLIALRRGATFEQLAPQVFTDPQLRDTGGDLGYFSVGDMDPAFEEAAYTAVVGELVGPVRTAQGYSVLRVEDRVTNPFLIETEYRKHRDNLLSYALYQKRKRVAQAHADSLRLYLDIRFNPETLQRVYDQLRTMPSLSPEEWPALLEQGDLWNREIVRSRLGRWDVRTLAQYARFTSATQRGWIRNLENLQDFIAGLVIRAHLLEQAKRMGLERRRDYRAKVAEAWEGYLLERMASAIDSAIVIPPDTLLAFYNGHPELFQQPERLRLALIALEDTATAKEVARRLQRGEDFGQLARRFSIDRRSAERGGEVGFFVRAELGGFADRLFAAPVGSWLGPVRVGPRIFFLKSLEKLPARRLSFQEALPEVQRTLKPFWRDRVRKQLLDQVREQVRIVRYDERLQSLAAVRVASEGKGK